MLRERGREERERERERGREREREGAVRLTLLYTSIPCSPAERSEEDVELIYDELIHIGPFRHLSNAVSLHAA